MIHNLSKYIFRCDLYGQVLITSLTLIDQTYHLEPLPRYIKNQPGRTVRLFDK